MFALGVWMVELNYYHPWYHDAPELHKSVGVIVTLLLLVRIGIKLFVDEPEPIGSKLEKTVARFTHYIIYIVLLALVTSGYLISTAEGAGISVFGVIEVPAMLPAFENQEDIMGELHKWLAYSLMALLALHIGGALKHQVLDNHPIFERMGLSKKR